MKISNSVQRIKRVKEPLLENINDFFVEKLQAREKLLRFYIIKADKKNLLVEATVLEENK